MANIGQFIPSFWHAWMIAFGFCGIGLGWQLHFVITNWRLKRAGFGSLADLLYLKNSNIERVPFRASHHR